MKNRLLCLIFIGLWLSACQSAHDKKYVDIIHQVLQEEGYAFQQEDMLDIEQYSSGLLQGIRQLRFSKAEKKISLFVTAYADKTGSISNDGVQVLIDLNKIIAKSTGHYRGYGENIPVDVKIYAASGVSNEEIDTIYKNLYDAFFIID